MVCLILVVRGGESERQAGIFQNVVFSRITDSNPDRIPRDRAEILDDDFCPDDPIDAIPVAHGTDYREICAFRAEATERTFCGLDDEHGARSMRVHQPAKLIGDLLGL